MRRSAAWIDGLVTLLAALAMAGVLILPLPWVRFWPRGVMAAAAAGGFFWLNVTLFGEARLWLGLVEPLAAMAVAFAGGTVWNYLAEGRERRAIRFAFQHYLAPAVVDELVRDPSKLRLGGERREITCFFSDIAGFTTISESMEPATLVTLMNEVLGEMTELILAEGGTIDKYIGDAIVGIFGAPLDQPDHAERACVAALRCQQRLEQLRAKWQAEGLPALEVRIGLNSGVALVGNMGAAQRFDYTMLGDVVNLGARLEGTNKVYGTPTLVGAETRQLAGEAILMRPLDSVRVKGKRLPVEVYEPLALAAEASDDERALAERFERALAAYRGQRWEEARAALASVREVRPEDGPARVLAERIARFEAEPPGAQWDGVFEMTTK